MYESTVEAAEEVVVGNIDPLNRTKIAKERVDTAIKNIAITDRQKTETTEMGRDTRRICRATGQQTAKKDKEIG